MSKKIYLVVKKTQSRKSHPDDIHGAFLFPSEAEKEMMRLNRISFLGDRWTVEVVKALGVLDSPRVQSALDQPYDMGSGV